MGLLINSSNLITGEDVYVATSIENVSMSSACDFHNCKSWMVYAMYTSTREGQAAGDVFVMTRERVLAMVINGAEFTKLSISKLEKFLDSANAKPSSESAVGNKAVLTKETKPYKSPSTEISSDGFGRSECTTPLSSPLSLANYQAHPRNVQAQQTLFKLLSETSGTPITFIDSRVTLQELGIDSLSAIELKDDLEDAFELEIEDDRFTLQSTVQEILDFLSSRWASQEVPSLQAPTASMTTDQAEDSRSSSEEKISAKCKKIELASPMEALGQCQAIFEQSAAQRDFLRYCTDIAPKQDELLLAYICEAFETLGSSISRSLQGKQLPNISPLPRHAKVMNRILEILEKHDVLTRQGSELIRGSRQAPSKSSHQLHKQFIAQFPAYSSEAQLMALTGPKLADCLTGKADPVSLLFRVAAAQKVMEDYYCASPMLSTLTEHMVNFIRVVVTSSISSSSNNPLRILEVGAGFGGTTTRLAEVLQASGVPVSYNFTDISPLLVKGARAKFGKYPWMEFQNLNLENDMPASLKGTYDIIIGTNCVHATSNKTKTIGRLKSLLNDQGFIVLSEVTQPVDWYDIVFGLLDGWWLANDGSTYPLQPPESWVRSFEQAGFLDSRITYSRGSSPESNIQRLLVASNKHEIRAGIWCDRKERPSMQTVVYKEVEDTVIEADIYLPAQTPEKAMTVGTRSFA